MTTFPTFGGQAGAAVDRQAAAGASGAGRAAASPITDRGQVPLGRLPARNQITPKGGRKIASRSRGAHVARPLWKKLRKTWGFGDRWSPSLPPHQLKPPRREREVK